jgi:hypothetical protein
MDSHNCANCQKKATPATPQTRRDPPFSGEHRWWIPALRAGTLPTTKVPEAGLFSSYSRIGLPVPRREVSIRTVGTAQPEYQHLHDLP